MASYAETTVVEALAAVAMPIFVLSKVVVKGGAPVIPPAEVISKSFELMAMSSSPSPKTPAPLKSRLVKLPAALVEPPIITPSRVVVEMERLVAVPAELMSQVLESMTTPAELLPNVVSPVEVRVVNVPAADVVPPIVTPSRVVVEMERLVAVPAELMSQVLESMTTPAELLPNVVSPVEVRVVNVPAADVVPPIVTPSRVVVEMQRLVAVPAE